MPTLLWPRRAQSPQGVRLATPAPNRSKSEGLTIRLVSARLELTSAQRANVDIEGPAFLTDGPEGKLITECVQSNRFGDVCHVTVPRGSVVNVHSKSGDVLVFSFEGTLRAGVDLGTARIDHASGTFRIVLGAGMAFFERLTGRLEVLTASAGIQAYDINGDVQCVSDHGSMKFETIKGPLVARTTTGEIVARDVTGIARLSTRSGDLRVKGVERQLTLRSQGGDISLESTIVDHTTIETSKGRIEVKLGRGSDARISASARQGLVRSQRISLLPGSGRRTLRSMIGGGRARLSLTTAKGLIEIAGPTPERRIELPLG